MGWDQENKTPVRTVALTFSARVATTVGLTVKRISRSPSVRMARALAYLTERSAVWYAAMVARPARVRTPVASSKAPVIASVLAKASTSSKRL